MKNKPKKRKSVLVIEDERPLIQIIKEKLEKDGFDVITARTIDQALSYVEDISPDAVWLDHYLVGEKTGIDFVTTMKSPNSKWSKIPIFIVSNTASSENVLSYMRLGVTKYYVKANHRLDEMISDIELYLNKPDE